VIHPSCFIFHTSFFILALAPGKLNHIKEILNEKNENKYLFIIVIHLIFQIIPENRRFYLRVSGACAPACHWEGQRIGRQGSKWILWYDRGLRGPGAALKFNILMSVPNSIWIFLCG